LSVLFFDADNFKRVNDVYGHSVGDAVLCEVGNRVQATLRVGDSVGRYGGEEFVVLLPETDLALACEIAERLLLVIATRLLVVDQVDGGLGVTLSIGVATFPTDGQTADEMLEQADQAMYRAKQSGRNRVRTALQNNHTKRDSPLAATIE
jgi:diguanylate cyclase (GGDEF)-like protein